MADPGGASTPDAADLVRAARAGSARAVARLVTLVESGPASARSVSAALTGLPRTAPVIGLTGPPGVGKSSLVARLITAYRTSGARVAVVAVDPSSPFTGGAVLGDRVRMAAVRTETPPTGRPDTAEPPAGRPGTGPAVGGVYIRSMSARGELGGLAAATPGVLDLLAALGFDVVLLETVGVGQNEVAVLRLADAVLVVTAPGLGDEVQIAKAGVLEIADILVVNKADLPRAAGLIRELRGMLALGRITRGGDGSGPAAVDICATVATAAPDDASDGIEGLRAAIDRRLLRPAADGSDGRQRSRAAATITALLHARLDEALRTDVARAELAAAAALVTDAAADVHLAADRVTRALHGGGRTETDLTRPGSGSA